MAGPKLSYNSLQTIHHNFWPVLTRTVHQNAINHQIYQHEERLWYYRLVVQVTDILRAATELPILHVSR